MPKSIQIDYKLFCDICNYFFDENAPQDFETDEIRRQLNEKIEKIINRELFSKYKRTPTGVEREKARKEYLDHKGILEDFRSDSEQHEPDF